MAPTSSRTLRACFCPGRRKSRNRTMPRPPDRILSKERKTVVRTLRANITTGDSSNDDACCPHRLMNPSRSFILRPVAPSLLMLAVLLVGLVSFKFLPLSALPEVAYPTIQIQTFYPGASPEVMTSSITAPLERQLGEMPSLKQMSSASSAGASVITLQFGLDLSLDIAEQEVQAAINAAGNLLPSDLPAPPIYAKVNPADAPVLTLALTSKTLPNQIRLPKLLVQMGLAASGAEANRKIAEKAVKLDGEPAAGNLVSIATLPARIVVRLGKRAKIAVIS